jgi:ABC-type uncharacterized transport system ATPase subunit
VLRLADDVLVLRDGAVVGRGPRSDFDEDRLVSLMVGREMETVFPARRGGPTVETALEARGASSGGRLRDLRFTLHRGEILGLAGLMGAGRTETLRALFGLDPLEGGEVLVAGQRVSPSPHDDVRVAPSSRLPRILCWTSREKLGARLSGFSGSSPVPATAHARRGLMSRRRLKPAAISAQPVRWSGSG